MQRLPNLPEEVMVDIFSRLPAKSVGRCRCLSKPWQALLSQPDFSKTHLNQSIKRRQKSLLLISEEHNYLCSAPFNDAHQLFDEITIPTTKLDFAGHPDSWFEVYASCNGLVLARDTNGNTFVLNPITREIRQVPNSPCFLEPDESFKMYGFGYDSVNDDYIVVIVSRYDTENGYGYTTDVEDDSDYCPEVLVTVYSMKSNTWEKVQISPYYCHLVASGVFLNGCIHWVGEVETSDSPKFVVVVFDMAEKKFTEIQPPSSFNHQMVYNSILVVLDGCLCVYPLGGSVFWVMKEYGVQESWTSFTINDLKGVRYDEAKVLCMLGQEEIVLWIEYDSKTVVYNLKQKTFMDVVFHGVPHNLIACTSFVESLISPRTLH